MFSSTGGWIMQANLRTARKSGQHMKSEGPQENGAKIQNKEVRRGKLIVSVALPQGAFDGSRRGNWETGKPSRVFVSLLGLGIKTGACSDPGWCSDAALMLTTGVSIGLHRLTAQSVPQKPVLTSDTRPPALLTNWLQIWGFPWGPQVHYFIRMTHRTQEGTIYFFNVIFQL